ncbi:MAG: sulfatase-like hydrolase/transferase [Candidatus Hydrogenedens sp.]|nr:sulfatase-like hydrolase/transferase [Candidatus Hydrogenedens sp.]
MRIAPWLLSALLLSLTASQGAEARQPNVIILYTDDQGAIDAPGFGADDLALPHLAALADGGVRLTQCYAPAPVCSPSRAGLLTGRYPYRAGVPGNVSSTHGDAGMPGSEVTMAEMFKAAGYATGHFGKWHLGFTPETMPNAQGFDYSFGHMGGCIDNYSHFFYWQGPNRHDLYRNGEEIYEDGKYFPDLVADEAGRFIGEHRDTPFFLYIAINMPHYPYQGKEHWLKHYQDQGTPYPRDLYAAFLSSMDDVIGDILARLDGEGLADDTIVVYQADNGYSVEDRAHYGGGSAGPYRGAKFSMFEGGIRVPAAIRWPGHLPAGAVCDKPAHGTDWLPTLADLCGVAPPERPLDGKSIAAMLRDPDAPSPHEAMVWHLGRGRTAQWAVRQGDWKLKVNNNDPTTKDAVDSPFLANLADDPGEQTNRAAEHPELIEQLTAVHEAWLADVEREEKR